MAKINNEIDEVFAEAGFQEKVYCWFRKYRKHVYITLGSVGVLLLIILSGVIIKDKKIEKMQKDYLSLTTTDSKLRFVKNYRAQPLCGVVLLGLGDDAASQKDFSKAISYYDLAYKALRGTYLSARALVFSAEASLKLGNKAVYETNLDKVVHDSAASLHFRADAMYRLINYYRSEGKQAKITELTHYARGLDFSDNWLRAIEAVAN